MAFALTHVRTGQQVVFTVREILELLGDPINDEILIHGQAYRIASVQGDLGGGTGGSIGTVDWKKQTITVGQSGQSSFEINITPSDPEGLFMVVNGALFDYGTDGAFHIDSGKLYWHGRFQLEPTDIVYLKFLTLI